MSLLVMGSIVKSVGDVADDLFTYGEERLKAALREKIDTALIQRQLTVNAQEAQNYGSIFVAGWWPFIGRVIRRSPSALSSKK